MSEELAVPADGEAHFSGDIEHTPTLRSRDWWVNWVLAVPFDDDGDPDFEATPTKQPVAPYDTGHAKPVRWHAGLADDEHPSTSFAEVIDWDGMSVGLDIEGHERVLSDEIGIGIIIPVGGGEGRPITLLDWDDVRDPETGEIHPVCAEALDRLEGFAEISQSGEGVHQFVFGEIPGGMKKFLRHIDDEPFVGDELPMVEMYSSGRLTAMTGRHIAGCGDDVVDGQELIDDLCWRFGTWDNNNEGTPTDPFENERGEDIEYSDTPDHDEVGESLREAVAYDGDDPAEWDIPDGEPVEYHAVLRAREREPEMVNTANWELLGYAAAFAHKNGIPKGQLIEDLKAHDRPGYEFDEQKARKEIRGVWRKAEAGNYEPPSQETLVERGVLPERYADDSQPDADAWPWQSALWSFENDEADDGLVLAADALEAETSFMFVRQSEILWRYDDETGRYQPDAEAYIRERLEAELSSHYSIARRNEVTDRVKARNTVERGEINAKGYDQPLLCVGNGVVNLATGELSDHGPEYLFIRGLEWDYDPDADQSAIRDFFSDITKREADWQTIVDHLAHGLMPGHPYRAFVMTYGPGGNGKTQLGELIRGFVGEDNAAAVEMEDLTGDEFSTGALPGAFVNVGDDVGLAEIRDTSTLKTASGGGTLRANKKHEKKFAFKNEAAMFFSANEPPRIAEDKQSIDDRLYPIEMPYRFVDDPDPDEQPPEKPKTSGIAEKLLADEAAMRGLLALAVEHAQRLIETDGNYSMPEGPDARRDIYEAASDPIRRFALELVEEGDAGDKVLKDDAYSVYTSLCKRDDERPASADQFKDQMAKQALIDIEHAQTRQLTPGDSRNTCWTYVRFTEAAKPLMSGRLLDRYWPGEGEELDDYDDGDESEEDGGVDQERAAFGADPICDAADTLTGYVTVTAKVATVMPLGETDSGRKAILKDASGAMDFVSWDAEMNQLLDGLEDECVLVRNAEVSQYDGAHQLSVVDGLTDIEQIQQGVGFTELAEPGGDQSGLHDTAEQRMVQAQERVLSELQPDDRDVAIAELAGRLNEEPDDIKATVEKLSEKGRVIYDGETVTPNQ